jgi:hypothetical protein
MVCSTWSFSGLVSCSMLAFDLLMDFVCTVLPLCRLCFRCHLSRDSTVSVYLVDICVCVSNVNDIYGLFNQLFDHWDSCATPPSHSKTSSDRQLNLTIAKYLIQDVNLPCRVLLCNDDVAVNADVNVTLEPIPLVTSTSKSRLLLSLSIVLLMPLLLLLSIVVWLSIVGNSGESSSLVNEFLWTKQGFMVFVAC